ncbi:MAG: hypothetical protein MI724_08320, partial [Spirochaetales bacterium]|nr:hypothetical protein [Spirochaetales bacterium]
MGIEHEDVEIIASRHYSVYEGSLGSIVRFNDSYSYGKGHKCLLNSDIPSNLHEYNVIIIDMCSKKEI